MGKAHPQLRKEWFAKEKKLLAMCVGETPISTEEASRTTNFLEKKRYFHLKEKRISKEG